ncbi:MAG: thermonuclease family protein [Nitrospirae bacterium]|nr:thermonuclease family protein [Nitrospirota bacterium]
MDQETGGSQEKTGVSPVPRFRRRAVPVGLLGTVLFFSGLLSGPSTLSPADSGVFEAGNLIPVKRVIDGDTIELVNGETVRYLGIDAPELRKKVRGRWVEAAEPFAAEASELNRRWVEGRRVRLERDKEDRDRFHRLLAYVFVEDHLVNAELISSGYATVRLHPPNLRYADLFMKLQAEALAHQRGLWASASRGSTP